MTITKTTNNNEIKYEANINNERFQKGKNVVLILSLTGDLLFLPVKEGNACSLLSKSVCPHKVAALDSRRFQCSKNIVDQTMTQKE